MERHLSNALVRPTSIVEHPLHDRRYRLPTPPIDALYTLITEALDRRRPGVMVYGRSRLGKTTAIAYIEALLSTERPALPVFTLRCRFKRVPSETAFFSNFLAAVRHKATGGRDAEQMRQRLIHRMCEMADAKASNQILLFADEAQNLGSCEYEWLRDVHDDLQRWGKTLLVVLVGQPELHGQKATFQRSNSMHIVSRFMVLELAFRLRATPRTAPLACKATTCRNSPRTPAGPTPASSSPWGTPQGSDWPPKGPPSGMPLIKRTAERFGLRRWRSAWSFSLRRSSI